MSSNEMLDANVACTEHVQKGSIHTGLCNNVHIITCYYCHKEGHYAKFCPKKITKRIQELLPEKFRKGWEKIKEIKRIPPGWCSALPKDLKLYSLLKRYNATRILYNKKVDAELERLMDRVDKELLKELLTDKDMMKVEADKIQAKKEMIMERQRMNVLPEIKKIDNIIKKEGQKEIDSMTAKQATLTVIEDKIERDKKLEKLLDNVIVAPKNEASTAIKIERKDVKDKRDVKEKIKNVDETIQKYKEDKKKMMEGKSTVEKANILLSQPYQEVKNAITKLEDKKKVLQEKEQQLVAVEKGNQINLARKKKCPSRPFQKTYVNTYSEKDEEARQMHKAEKIREAQELCYQMRQEAKRGLKNYRNNKEYEKRRAEDEEKGYYNEVYDNIGSSAVNGEGEEEFTFY